MAVIQKVRMKVVWILPPLFPAITLATQMHARIPSQIIKVQPSSAHYQMGAAAVQALKGHPEICVDLFSVLMEIADNPHCIRHQGSVDISCG